MNRLLIILATLISLSLPVHAGEDWLTQIEAGVAAAKEQNKNVLVEFTGSDWCPPCIMMEKKVFSKKRFLEESQKDFVLVKIDIPNADPELKEKNSKVMEKWRVDGVPTVLLLDAEGEEYHRFSASTQPTVKSFLQHIKRATELKGML